MPQQTQADFEKIASFPQYPTIGAILKEFADIPGLTEKEFDFTRSFRRLLQRLDKQKAGEIDLDNYQEFVNTVLDQYNSITKDFNFHWLDEGQIFHYFRAYQNLILEVPMFAIDQKVINNIVGVFFLIWTVRRYVRWIQIIPKTYFEKYTRLWILENLDPSIGLIAIFENLKINLGDKDMTDWAMVGQIHSGKDLSHDEQKDFLKQIKSWINKGRVSSYSKVLEKIIEPLSVVSPEVAKIFEIDFLGWRWISTWIQYVKLEESTVLDLLKKEFSRCLQSTVPQNTAIPSSEMLLEGSRIQDLRSTFQVIAKLLKNPTFLEEWSLINLNSATSRCPQIEADDTENLMKMMELSEYRHGDDFNNISSFLMEKIADEIPDHVERVFKLRYLHGLIPSNYRDTKSWLNYQRDKAPRLELKTISHIHLSDNNLRWLNNWDSGSINQFKTFEGVNRTRLMIAAFRGNYKLTQKLIKEGADPLILSHDNSNGIGDNSSALFLSLLALEGPILKEQQENIEKIIQFLLVKMRLADPSAVKLVMNTRHSITKRVPLNIAIDLGRLFLVNIFLEFGTDCNAEIGGDDRTPIYLSIDVYGRYKNQKTWGEYKNLSKRTTPNIMHMETGPAALQAIELESGPETARQLNQWSYEFLQKQKPKSVKPYQGIIETLVKHEAEINKLNRNGRYPLDMAIEIKNTSLIKIITCLGAYKRAVL